MTVTLKRQPFTPEERELFIDAIMSGCAADWPELDEIAIEIAEKLPELLRHARLPDTSENRRRIINLVLTRYAQPKGPKRSRSYRRLARR